MTDPARPAPVMPAAFARRLILLVGLGFLALVAAAFTIAWQQARNEASSDLVEHTMAVETRIGEFASANEQAETARRGILLSSYDGFRQRMDEATQRALDTLDAVERLTADNPAQTRRVQQLRQLMMTRQGYQHSSTAYLRRMRDRDSFDFDTDPGVAITRRVRALAGEMLSEERRLLAQRQSEQAQSLRSFYLILGGTGLLLLIVAGATITIMLRYTRELAQSRSQLERMNRDLEGMVAERTTELQRANAEIQRFAYIVSHDLRSPLVNVMGFTAELDAARKTVAGFLERVEAEHADLADEATRLAVREDLPEAIGFIRTSTQKMDRLINAILRLSREGRRTLTPERIDMDALVQTIMDSIQHRVSDAGAEIIAEPLPEIVSDRFSIDQILSNLVENAVKYLKPGRPGLIRIRGHAARDRIVYEVEDNGRGVDPRDHERIFDLFRRSGAQDQPGEGIGLAHVRALAYRLGGIIEVTSELDRGSTFRLSLPRVLRTGNGDDEPAAG